MSDLQADMMPCLWNMHFILGPENSSCLICKLQSADTMFSFVCHSLVLYLILSFFHHFKDCLHYPQTATRRVFLKKKRNNLIRLSSYLNCHSPLASTGQIPKPAIHKAFHNLATVSLPVPSSPCPLTHAASTEGTLDCLSSPGQNVPFLDFF